MADEGADESSVAAVAEIATPEDTRWFLSKLVPQMEPNGRNKVWQKLAGVRVPSAADRQRKEEQWKNSPTDEEADNAGENDAETR
jgi:hypothetical protein